MSKGWDNTTIKKLKTLIGKGLSTSEIGKRLGLSKNAVVGKLNRLGWNSKSVAAPVAHKSGKKTEKTSAKKTPVKVVTKKATAKPVTQKAKSTPKKTPAVTTAKKTATTTGKKTSAKKIETPKSTAKSSTTKATPKNLAMHQRIIQHSLEMANLKPNQCRWPIGDPDSENFHFCGKQVFTGKPYCYEHCRLAYQFTPPKKK